MKEQMIKGLTDQQLVACHRMATSHYQVRRFNMDGKNEWQAEPQDFVDEMARRNMTAVQYIEALEHTKKHFF